MEKIKEIEAEMARTQKNKVRHIGSVLDLRIKQPSGFFVTHGKSLPELSYLLTYLLLLLGNQLSPWYTESKTGQT